MHNVKKHNGIPLRFTVKHRFTIRTCTW